MNGSAPKVSILDQVVDCCLLHRGGEADVYGIAAAGSEFVLKWYGKDVCYDKTVVEKLERLNLQGLYRIRESGSRENIPYLVYDFIQGVDSATVLPMPVPVALGLLREIAQTLNALEKNGIHHGDLNPSNVMLCRTGKDLHTVLIDCGIVGPGALAFAAPERFQGKGANTKSDLFSLGMLLFRWVSGRDLLETSGYDDMAAKSASIDQVDVTEILYGIGLCSAQELSALEPLWKSLLRVAPDSRAEDFDELDELLEIALASLGMGAVSLSTAVQKYAESVYSEKMGRKFPRNVSDGEKVPLPYKKAALRSKKSGLKFVVLGLFGLILVICALLALVRNESPDIDATGNLLLEKSRSLETAPERSEQVQPVLESIPLNELGDLPTPAENDLP